MLKLVISIVSLLSFLRLQASFGIVHLSFCSQKLFFSLENAVPIFIFFPDWCFLQLPVVEVFILCDLHQEVPSQQMKNHVAEAHRTADHHRFQCDRCSKRFDKRSVIRNHYRNGKRQSR
jgi:hypothetical protein